MNILTHFSSAEVMQYIDDLDESYFVKQLLRMRFRMPFKHAGKLDELYELVKQYESRFNSELIISKPHNESSFWLRLYKTKEDAEDSSCNYKGITPVKSFLFSVPMDTGRFEISNGAAEDYGSHSPTKEFFDKFFDVLNFGGVLYNDDDSDDSDDSDDDDESNVFSLVTGYKKLVVDPAIIGRVYNEIRGYQKLFRGTLVIHPPTSINFWMDLYPTKEAADMAPEVRKKRNITPVKSFSFGYPIDTGRFEISDGRDDYRGHSPNKEFFDKFFDVQNFGGVLYADSDDDESD